MDSPSRNPYQLRQNPSAMSSDDDDDIGEYEVPLRSQRSRRSKPSLRNRIKDRLRSSSRDRSSDTDDGGETNDNHRNNNGSGGRDNHLRQLISQKRSRKRYFNRLMRKKDSNETATNVQEEAAATPTRQGVPTTPSHGDISDDDVDGGTTIAKPKLAERSNTVTSNGSSGLNDTGLSDQQKEALDKTSKGVKFVQEQLEPYQAIEQEFPIEVRMKQLTYSVPINEESSKIQTVYNTSAVYPLVKYFKTLGGSKQEEIHHPTYTNGGRRRQSESEKNPMKKILDNVSLTLQPGKMYLVLGPPGCGKSTLLRAIAGRLSTNKGEKIEGAVAYNGKTFEDKTKFHIDNAISFIDQLDRHAPRLTVDETFEFAFQCKRGGTHVPICDMEDTPQNRDLVKQADARRLTVETTLLLLGLDHVRDTYVGDDIVRGVSGGQRRRVTCGEMMMDACPITCGDEISNGLDASSTFEIIEILMYMTQRMRKIRVISLLQPSPETVSLFDEIILLAEGNLLYSGPIGKVEEYFVDLGYKAPRHMDVADFLQLLSTPDGFYLYDPSLNTKDPERKGPHTAAELAEIFRNSSIGDSITKSIRAPHKQVWGSAHHDLEKHEEVDHLEDKRFRQKYANSFPKSIWLNLKRNMTIWIRDKRVLIANAAKNAIMGVSVGGVFFQTDDVVSVLGVLFQGMLFIMLGAMTTAPAFCDERVIFYKQFDSNFYSALPFIIAKAASKCPQTVMDCFTFGTILYFMVGLAPTGANYFIFMAVIFTFSVLMNEYLFFFTTISRTKDLVQVVSACLVFFFILFSGFIIAPNVVPNYYSWIYWYNPMAWAYRALIVNEYRSDYYSEIEGDFILRFTGFVDANDQPFDQVWVAYSFAYMIGHILFTILLSAFGLTYIRISAESGTNSDSEDDVLELTNGTTGETSEVQISFKPVTLTFEDICYDVTASTSNEELRLLHNVSGAFKSGRMCALMGSSGAGKTTLMDVVAMRKNSGAIQGDVRLNGFPQEAVSFRRCSGYVEQFDVQTPQLTVRETVLFSARLRLDSNKVKLDEEKQRFCDQVLKTLELTQIADCLVGTMEDGGLSFEQKKRLSIAVELAASPSILFLDEPTTGLDARSALLVVKLLRKIADQGRTICATIHQPSSAVFDLFDDLLLLKTGGKVVYFGPTGEQSKDLIDYLESHGADRIDLNDNPANWMLREITSSANVQDLAEVYANSGEHELLKKRLNDVKENPVPALEISYSEEYAAPKEMRQKLMNKRLQTIYWRSPAYNLSRLLVCIVIAFILGSVFITDRNKQVFTESDMRAWFSVTFLSFIIIGILSITSVLPVMLAIRDVFYRHRAAGMIDNISLGWALGTAEKWFIVIASFLFCLVYIGTVGWNGAFLSRAIRFWGIFTFNLAIYSYFGQAFMCLVSSMPTAQILASVFIGLNNFFSGLIVRPQFLTGFFEITYWITPGHYVYEGLILAQFDGDNRTVTAVNNSDFYEFLECEKYNIDPCNGTITQYVYVFFGGRFNKDNELQDILVLALFLVSARVVTFFALKQFNFSDK